MNNLDKETIKLVSIRITLFLSLFMFFIFLTAYSHPDKLALIDINHFAEGKIELIIFLVVIPLVIIGTYWTQQDIKRQIKKLEQLKT